MITIEITPDLSIEVRRVKVQKNITNKMFITFYVNENCDINIEENTIVNCKFFNEYYLCHNLKILNCWNMKDDKQIVLYGEDLQDAI